VAKLQELREKRVKLRAKIEETRNAIEKARADKKHKGPIMDQEQRSAFDKLKAEFLAVRSEIESEERAVEVEQFLTDEVEAEERTRRGAGGVIDPSSDDRIPGSQHSYGDHFGGNRDLIRQSAQAEERRALVFSAWAVNGRSGMPLSDEQRSAIEKSNADLSGDMIIPCFSTQQLSECRAAIAGWGKEQAIDRGGRAVSRIAEQRVVAGTATQSNLAPQVTVEAMENAALTIGGLYNAAEVRVTPTGAKMVWPTSNDTSNEGVQIDEVTPQSLDGLSPNVNAFSVASYEFWSNFIRVGNVTLRDSPIALATEVGMMTGERIGRAINRKATSGDGINTLRGIEAAAIAAGVVAMATSNTYDWKDLYSLQFSVDGAYRGVGSYMMNDEVLVELMVLTDNEGRPMLINPNDGSLPRLLNRPVVGNNHMPAVADVSATRPAIVFGDLSKYKLRLVGNVRTSRLVERFSEFDQTAFDGKRGADGGLLNAGGNPVKALAPTA